MNRTLRPAVLAAPLLAALVLAGCGSDSSGSPGTGSGGSGAEAAPAAAGGGGTPSGPCDVTDQQTVASVFPGAGAGKPGKVRNCEYRFSGGALGVVNVFLFDGDLDAYKQQARSADVTFSPVAVGDGAIRDQIHTLTVQQGDTLFAVQALPRTGVAEKDLAKYDAQTLALAKKIAANL